MRFLLPKFFLSGLLLATAALPITTAEAANNLQQLPGFNQQLARPAFVALLRDDVKTYTFFQQNPEALKRVLETPSLQNQILRGSITLEDLLPHQKTTNTGSRPVAAARPPVIGKPAMDAFAKEKQERAQQDILQALSVLQNGPQESAVAEKAKEQIISAIQADKDVSADSLKQTIVAIAATANPMLLQSSRTDIDPTGTDGGNVGGGDGISPPPPTNRDCRAVEGVIPNDSRKLRVQYRALSPMRMPNLTGYVAPNVPAADLAKLSGDLAGGFLLEAGSPKSRWNVPEGTAVVTPFTTSTYNVSTLYRDLGFGDHPLSNGGVVYASISKCPADFTSPEVVESVCMAGVSNSSGRLIFGISPIAGSQICQLEPNQQYYLNITGGFVKSPAEYRNAPINGPWTAGFDPEMNYGGHGGAEHSFDIESKLRPDNLVYSSPRQPGQNLIQGLEATETALREAMNNWYNGAYSAMRSNTGALQGCLAAASAQPAANVAAARRACYQTMSNNMCSYVNGNPLECGQTVHMPHP